MARRRRTTLIDANARRLGRLFLTPNMDTPSGDPRGRNRRYHFEVLKVGESAYVPWPEYNNASNVSTCAAYYCRKYSPRACFRVSKVSDPHSTNGGHGVLVTRLRDLPASLAKG